MAINSLLRDQKNPFARIYLNYWLLIFILEVFWGGYKFRLNIFEIGFGFIHAHLCKDRFFTHWNNFACFTTHAENVRYPIRHRIILVKLNSLSLTQWLTDLFFNDHIVKGNIRPHSNRHYNLLWFELRLLWVTFFWMHHVNFVQFIIRLIGFWLAVWSAWAGFQEFKWKQAF